MSGLSRFKICTFELGDGLLSSEELRAIQIALEAEGDRLRNLHKQLEFGANPTDALGAGARPASCAVSKGGEDEAGN
jgi:hypothetical protein